jgi:arginase family enzyme
MLAEQIRIINFDDSLLKQNNLIQRFHPLVTDLKRIGPSCRHWMNKMTAQEIKNSLDPALRNTITFIGSGDFHHISNLLIGQFQESLSVIVFDHHPDWEILPPRLSCGSWVSRILERDNVLKVILFGVSSDDISNFWIQTGNLTALRQNRLEIYPYSHKPTRVLLRDVPKNISLHIRERLFWQEIKNNNSVAFFSQIINRIPNKSVYISIDKDCLRAGYSLSNWEEGFFELNDLLAILKSIKEKFDIVGLDITGDYSSVQINGRIKSFFTKLDHPKDYTAKDMPEALVSSVNEQTNLKIIELLKN